ncbi:class I SAM-dependent methyltransferase [Corynebacterium mastitidis]|uniref:Class I SAM-dependent methyltransferase n=1 Tax=Corynebacterium mastitidis TaxID=161890 RepID=A0ABU8NZP4_9CORY
MTAPRASRPGGTDAPTASAEKGHGGISTTDAAVAAYSRRAGEYAAALGHHGATAAPDRAFLRRWCAAVDGPLVDLGCGPGHWTAFLHDLRARATGGANNAPEVSGMDPVPEFVTHARATYPGIRYEVGDDAHLPRGCGGVPAWYSLIHLPPPRLKLALARIARALRPGGSVAMGFFESPSLSPFDHAIAVAWRWLLGAMSEALAAAGLRVEHAETCQDPGSRPHAALVARRPPG